jgi:hypothetical protein
MTTKRDPRVDPRPGDVVRQRTPFTLTKTVRAVADEIVRWTDLHGAEHTETVWAWRWDCRACLSEIVKVAE